ncbi:ATP-binding protein [Fundidesulfovibrio butyratiphilus]
MREIVIVSGKGGSGKTSVTAALAHMAKNAVLCDLDVDAPDLHLLLDPKVFKREDFVSGLEAVVDPQKCEGCAVCADMCRFDAVSMVEDRAVVSPMYCEGCAVCEAFCPAKAITLVPKRCGEWYVSETRFGVMAHAQLIPGEENSGRLVALLKKQAREIARERGADTIVCDGAPGIGCPVISSFSGATLAVCVPEATAAGLHDLGRLLDLCAHFRMRACVIVNKSDLNEKAAEEIETLAKARDCEVVARLAHDDIFFQAMLQGKAVTEMPGNNAMAEELGRAWARIYDLAVPDRTLKVELKRL